MYGTTPIRYINRIRLRKAKELLVNTDTSVSEIADLVGFQSIHYFSRFFQSEGKLHAHGIPHAQRAEPLFQLSAAGRQQPVVRLLPPAKKAKILDNMQSNPGGFVL